MNVTDITKVAVEIDPSLIDAVNNIANAINSLSETISRNAEVIEENDVLDDEFLLDGLDE